MTARALLFLGLLVLSAGLCAQSAPTITSADIDYVIAVDCDGITTHIPPTLTAAGGSGNYAWAALTAVPAGLTLQSGGTFGGQLTAAGTMFSFDVQVTDTTTSLSSQETINMEVAIGTATCNTDPGEACSTGSGPGLAPLLVILMAGLLVGVRKAQRAAGSSQ